MGWIEVEAFWLFCPDFADELVWREALEGLQSSAEVIGCDEVAQMAAQVFMVVVVEAFDGSFLNRAVHAFDFAIGPWMFWSASLCGSWCRPLRKCIRRHAPEIFPRSPSPL